MDCIFLNKSYDVDLIASEISKIPEEYYYAHPGAPKSWFGVPVRNSTGTNDEIGLRLNHTLIRRQEIMAPCKNTPLLENDMPETLKIIEDLQKITSVHLVRILLIKSGGILKKHRDGDVFAYDRNKIYRLHLPIITNPKVYFEISGNTYSMEKGKLYFADVSKPHRVYNNGDDDRIHLVIDVNANKDMVEMVKNGIKLSPNIQISENSSTTPFD